MEIAIEPLLFAFSKVDIHQLFAFNESAFENPEFKFSSQTGILVVTTKYTKDIHELPFQLLIKFDNSESPYF